MKILFIIFSIIFISCSNNTNKKKDTDWQISGEIKYEQTYGDDLNQ